MKEEIFKMDFPTEIIQEGKVKVLVPKLKEFVKSPSEYAPSKAPVFYNPVMELNRDIAVLASQAYQRTLNREITVCEPLAGCGIRGIRFATEVEGVEKVVINDINAKAFQLASYNVRMNELSERVVVKKEDANFLLGSYGAPRKRFDVIDIDPFGCPVPYLDSAIRALRNSGLLILTATDMAPLCGVHPKACIRKYGGKPLRTEYCHELAVRLLAGSLAMTAAKYEMGINIIFSHSTDHYVRIYATAKYGAKKGNENVKNMGYILHCFKCLHRETAKGLFLIEHSGKCSECGSKISVAGPLWLGKLFDGQFCELVQKEVKRRAFKQGKKIRKIFTLIENEVEAPITYYVVDKLCDTLNLPVPPVKKVIAALEERGFQAVLTHFNSTGIRSNASASDMKELLLKIVRDEW
ncbi:tRNA (guanine(10)-N(2))-dimethyltransferase [Candidatus Bathyarchaeota archaeon]|nr:tRNA (guanine(10)-N(2))-dimethyltransferase [Candidatus Bathyarchaeota archaeon]